jgi:hypothetical protein
VKNPVSVFGINPHINNLPCLDSFYSAKNTRKNGIFHDAIAPSGDAGPVGSLQIIARRGFE